MTTAAQFNAYLIVTKQSQYKKGKKDAFKEMEDKCLDKIADLEREADRLHNNLAYDQEAIVRDKAVEIRTVLAEIYVLGSRL